MTSRINKPDTEADIILRECIDNNQSFVMIAGAGSGKTTSLIKGLQYVAEKKGEELKKQNQRIACITYTTVAENEIISDINGDPLFHVSTIHSFLWELIRPFQTDIKQWVKNRIDEKITKLIETKNAFGARVQQRTKDKNQTDTEKYLELKVQIDLVNNFSYETGSNYEKGILGHDDIIKMAPQLINEKPLLRVILAKKYPYLFIDESQDTKEEVINSLVLTDKHVTGNFCLGFFGDPMQKIYTTGIGNIPIQPTWKEIIKPENFRSPQKVLSVINNIRKNGDEIEQTGGKRTISNTGIIFLEGSANLFILPANTDRHINITKVRSFIASKNDDQLWLTDDSASDLKVLVIEHRMAAKRLQFETLFSIFKDGASDAIYSSFSEGKHWALRPFQTFIIPLITAHDKKDNFQIMELLRAQSPLFQKENLKGKKANPSLLFANTKHAIEELIVKIKYSPQSTFGDIFKFVEKHRLMLLDERISSRLNDLPIVTDEDTDVIDRVISNYFDCPISQIWGYQTYINDESAYSTQHSIKGAEFDRVLLILDDEEGANSTLYSYEKLLGLKEMSPTDQKNVEEGNDSVFGRTRRLLYVCCSRAEKDLAVILFVNDVESAYNTLKEANIFPNDCIHTVQDLK